jgi:hypothetical protein
LVRGDESAIPDVYDRGSGYDVEFPATIDPTHVVVMHAADIEAVPAVLPVAD